jgi:hypothetical protein
MSFVTQEIASLTGGVSQAPPQFRLDSQLQTLVNGWVEATRGLGKRPPSEHVAQLDSDNTNLGAAFLHTINRQEDERYRVVIENGDLKVYNAAGSEQTVTFPHGKAYLAESSPITAFAAVTAGDSTYVVNKTQTVSKSTDSRDLAPALVNEALVWIREGDFSTNYFAYFAIDTGNREKTVYNATITSGEGTDTTERTEYDAKYIADKMYAKMVGTANGEADMLNNGWEVTQLDTVIHVKRTNGADFEVAAGEGLEGTQDKQLGKWQFFTPEWSEAWRRRLHNTADRNIMVVLKETVGRIEDLPPVAPEGYRVEVVGSDTTEWDNYWFRFTNGSWEECIAPTEVVALDASTMPHRLLRSTKVYDNMNAINIPVPVVSTPAGTGAEVTEAAFYEALNDSGSAIDADNLMTTSGLAEGSQTVYGYSNIEGADGVSTQYVFTFTIDCRALGTEQRAFVSIDVNDGVASTNWTNKATQYYTKADGIKTDTITFTATVTTNWDMRITLDSNLDWEIASKYATLLPTSIVFTALGTNTPQVIDLHEDRIYPKGAVVTATVNGNDNAYTVTGDDETADEVATGLEVLIEDDTGITSSVSGHEITVNHSTTTPTITIATSIDPQKTVILDRAHGFAADALAALTVDNRTDISSSTITTNGTRSITCASALTGGTDNTFEHGDEIRVITGSSTFSFGRINWDRRTVGSEKSNPWPSFVDVKIDEIFLHAGRLGVTHDESVVLTRAGEHTNWFRKTARQLLDGDGIDVTYSGKGSSLIHSAVETNNQMVFFTELGQLQLTGEPTLTPRTAELVPLTYYENTKLVRPIPYGDRVMFLQADAGATQAFAFHWRRENLPTGDPLGEHVPTYIQGNPLAWAVSTQHSLVAVLTDDDQSVLYVGRLVETRDRGIDASWMKWQFGANDSIIGVDVIDDTLGLVVLRDEGLFLDTINLSEQYHSDHYMDRRLADTDCSDALNGSDTDITLPFDMPDGDGDFIVYDTTNGVEYSGASITRPDATTVKVVGADVTAASYYLGWKYTFTGQLSEIFNRHWRTGAPVLGGILQLGNILQHYSGTIDLTITVTVNATDYTYTVSNSSASAGSKRAPVNTQAKDATIVYTNATSRPVWLQGLSWEGTYSARGRKL